MSEPIRNVVVISDLHCGCQVGLCPPTVRLDSGGTWHQGPTQRLIYDIWGRFWDWVDVATRGEPFAVVVNGDAMDGAHHGSKTQITQNFADQQRIAYEILAPIRDKCGGRLRMVRGTEAHVGQCAENEERLAEQLGAIPDETGNHSTYDLWLEVGHGLVHSTHHIGTTSRMAYETSGLMGEFAEMLADAGLNARRPPDVVVRSHRHRHIEVRKPSANVYGIVFTTAAWQARTPFVWKVARVGDPQIGGSLVRCGDEELYTRHFVQFLPRSKSVSFRG